MTDGGQESGGGAKKHTAMAVAGTLGIRAMRIFFTISVLLFIFFPA